MQGNARRAWTVTTILQQDRPGYQDKKQKQQQQQQQQHTMVKEGSIRHMQGNARISIKHRTRQRHHKTRQDTTVRTDRHDTYPAGRRPSASPPVAPEQGCGPDTQNNKKKKEVQGMYSRPDKKSNTRLGGKLDYNTRRLELTTL